VPTKTKRYAAAKFTPTALRNLWDLVSRLEYEALSNYAREMAASPEYGAAYQASGSPSPQDAAPVFQDAQVSYGDEDWTFDNFDEFLGEYRKDTAAAARFLVSTGFSRVSASLEFLGASSTVSITSRTRAEVERIFDIFEEDLPKARLTDPESAIQRSVRIFIGHGRDPSWRDLKDHLQDQHGFAVTAYEIGARAGYSVQEVLEEMVKRASFALLVHTGEDETHSDDALQARQNVVHETGLFQGRLGFRRAIILREDGCRGFSNVVGTGELRFSKGHIREIFGDVLATIYREFGAPQRDT
jgi:predicted nucleotide-binding protein